MPDQDSIFEKEQAVQNTQETPENKEVKENPNSPENKGNDPYADLLGSILNERGEQKYKTLEDALVGLKNAQEYIPKIKQEATKSQEELENLRKKVEELSSLEEVVHELTQRQEQQSTDSKALSEEDIAKLVENTLTKKQQLEIQQNNIKTVVSTITEKYGDDAEKVFYSKAEEYGMSKEEINAMAARTPKAVLALLGVSGEGAHKQPEKFSPTQGKINTSSYQPTPESYLGREEKSVTIGATYQDMKEAADRAAKLAEELSSKGMSTYDLTDPKVYFKYFNRK